MSIDVAQLDDLDDIRTLLQSSRLPAEDLDVGGVQAHWVWRNAGRVVGTVGLDVVGVAEHRLFASGCCKCACAMVKSIG